MNPEPDLFAERMGRTLRPGKVWVRADCLVHGRRGVYHWTRACVVEALSLAEIDRATAEASDNLRPCKLCSGGGKGQSRYHR